MSLEQGYSSGISYDNELGKNKFVKTINAIANRLEKRKNIMCSWFQS